MPVLRAGYRSLAAVLCCLVLGTTCPGLWAQAPNASRKLVISILSGEGALNDVRQRTAREPIVQVEDENHKPVAGAAVVFLLPNSGPGGTFAGGAQSFSTMTDAAGRAAAQGLRPNNIAGSYNIHVTVHYQGSTAETSIHQQNVSAGQSSANQSSESEASTSAHVAHVLSLKAILIIVGAAAAAGTVAGIVATRGSNATVITPGTPSVGAPTGSVSIRIPLGSHH